MTLKGIVWTFPGIIAMVYRADATIEVQQEGAQELGEAADSNPELKDPVSMA